MLCESMLFFWAKHLWMGVLGPGVLHSNLQKYTPHLQKLNATNWKITRQRRRMQHRGTISGMGWISGLGWCIEPLTVLCANFFKDMSWEFSKLWTISLRSTLVSSNVEWHSCQNYILQIAEADKCTGRCLAPEQSAVQSPALPGPCLAGLGQSNTPFSDIFH